MRALAALASLVVAGCGASASGDFDGVIFAPTGTAFAVADRHDFLPSAGSVRAVKRSDAGMKLHMLFTSAAVDVTEAWGQMTSDALLDAREDLALQDGVILSNIPLSRAIAGETMEVELSGEGQTGQGAFDAAVVVAAPRENDLVDRGYGDLVTVRAIFDGLDAPARGGYVVGKVEVKRERASGQDGDLATGEVTLDFRLPFTAERLGEANLAVARPVMTCAAKRGPLRAGSCKDEAPEPYYDETGAVLGR